MSHKIDSQINYFSPPLPNNNIDEKLLVYGSASSNSQSQNNGDCNNVKATKLNGLKNRIIQRPPPLILDKVSNFYDNNDIHSPANNNHQQQTQQQQQPSTHVTQTSNDQQQNNAHSSDQQVNEQQVVANSSGNSNGANGANLKFWASLNQNVTRSRSAVILGTARPEISNNNKISTAKDLTDSSADNLLGPDLVITHRNSTSTLTPTTGLSTNSDHRSASSAALTNHHELASISNKPNIAIVNESSVHQALDASKSLTNHDNSNSMSNHSEYDDSSTHGGAASENDGGNLIGVENPTPPPIPVPAADAVNNHRLLDEPPASASSNRPRSNNPFLTMEDDQFPTISLASESAVCKPPPSATMQLAHWTEAIYELNNAILESSSVAGGAEIGEFIYIIESGDIILELDHIKVSGFTLVEFNELLESKQVHLLSAVQTKHSHGLTLDLKRYLNCSFPKNSHDKELQDLIRENIYRRTIPCTTRPQRDGELDKVDYHFLTKEQFIEMNNRGMLLECGMHGGHYYGTMKPMSDLGSLSIYGSMNVREVSEDMSQPLNASHPAIGLANKREVVALQNQPIENPLYENHESLRLHQISKSHLQLHQQYQLQQQHQHQQLRNEESTHNGLAVDHGAVSDAAMPGIRRSNIVAVDSEALPHGWERVIDQTHGTYYIDHNTQRTQYEMPYEIELTKGSMGFGFTLVEADNGVLLVRSIIPGGPAHMNGTIRPGDILISAVGVSVAGLQHTDIARLFSTFAVGDRVRLTFARSTYVVDANLVPDEYLFSNGTNGDLAVAVNHPNNLYSLNNDAAAQNPHILVNQEYEIITVNLKRSNQGFGFTISDSVAGQKVKKIQNNELCSNLKQNDILLSIDGHDITRLAHKEVVERLKSCPVGREVSLTVKRKKRFRSRTPMAMPTENDEFSLDSTPQRNCKTPSIDGLMLRRGSNNQQVYGIDEPASRSLFSHHAEENHVRQSAQLMNYNQASSNSAPMERQDLHGNYQTMSNMPPVTEIQPIYGVNPVFSNDIYYNQTRHHHLPLPPLPHPPTTIPMFQANSQMDCHDRVNFRPPSISVSDGLGVDNMTNSVNPSETSLPPMKFADVNGLSQINQYNNFMNNDKLVMMQMQQQRYQQMMQPPISMQASSDYHHMPLYSNSDMMKANESVAPSIPIPIEPPVNQYIQDLYGNNYYANNEEIALQRVQYGGYNEGLTHDQSNHHQPLAPIRPPSRYGNTSLDEIDEHEYHQVDLHRDSKDSNWGIRLIGGSEVDRAISIGSIVFGGAASKNGGLKSGDEIISINGYNVVGATHQHVVDLISACANHASLIIRRKKYAEACEVVLNRNIDEGFGFVIISNDNCALIGKIEKGSPADRCQQLHKEDRVIAINGNYITPEMRHPEIVNMIKECGSTLRLRIIPADCYTVELIKSSQQDNFGFSMRGGSEYDGTPLYILRVAPKGLARDLLNVGDQIIEINGISTVGMTHHQAATIIKFSDPIVKLKLRRNYVTPPSLLVASPALLHHQVATAELKTF